MTHEKALIIARDYPTEMVAELLFDAHETIDSLLVKEKQLREALETCRAYAVHPVGLDDCFVIFNAADIALQEAET